MHGIFPEMKWYDRSKENTVTSVYVQILDKKFIIIYASSISCL